MITVHEFCKKEGVVRKVKKNIKNNVPPFPNTDIQELLDGYGFLGLFIWQDTPEGHKYWEELCKKFDELNEDRIWNT